MLSEKEKKLVQDPYFQVLRIIEDYDEDYIEIVSKCTEHHWAIRRKGTDVVLFHNHHRFMEYTKDKDGKYALSSIVYCSKCGEIYRRIE